MIKDLDDLMGFGKYADQTVEYVLNYNPQYLLWCLENVEDFELDKATQDAVMRACRK